MKKSNKRKNHKQTALRSTLRWVMMAALSIGLCFAITSSVLGGFFLLNAVGYVRGDEIIDLREHLGGQGRTTIIWAYDRQGNTVEFARLHGVENRIWVDLDDMGPRNPVTGMPLIADAFIALEDHRFWEHNGIDWRRFVSAVTIHGFTQGASTITQQLIKNLTGENQVTAIRKYREMMAALNMERHHDKESILEAYLNTVYLGNGNYGVLTGAEAYFGRHISELNIAEVAVLAAITQAPGYFNPLRNPQNNIRRQQVAITNMYHGGMITTEQFAEAMAHDLIFTNHPDFVRVETPGQMHVPEPQPINNWYTDFIIDTVIDDLMRVHGLSRSEATRRVYYGGLQIRAAVDIEIQEIMEDVFRNRTTWAGQVGPTSNPIHASMAIVCNDTGRVMGIVGGAGEKAENRLLNRAHQSFRQPGSTMKGLVSHGLGIESNTITWSTLTPNSAFAHQGNMWPRNADGGHGAGNMVNTQRAFQQSLNTVAARITRDIGARTAFDFLYDNFGFSRLDTARDPFLPPMALGAMTHGVSALEMAAAYATFGNGGIFNFPFAYHSVYDSQDRLLLSRDDLPESRRAYSECTAMVMNRMSQLNPISGFAHNNNLTNIQRFRTFGKTGSSQDWADRWFCGGTPYFTAAVWFGHDRPRGMGPVTNPAGRIWVEVFNRIKADTDSFSTSTDFPTTNRAVQRSFCTNTGLLAGPNCPTASGWYRTANLPRVCSGSCGTPAPDTNQSGGGGLIDWGNVGNNIGNWIDGIFGGGGGGNNNNNAPAPETTQPLPPEYGE
ncbi:MAG: transglycosylase domain-containing protein [Oscillospiraceae bacterium]|nr:transglycosylase domain-containing protein [Oscillospiraceae bacterium]